MSHRFLTAVFVIAFTHTTNGQLSCPAGKTSRTVKCNGQLLIKCVPVNHSCTGCWTVDFPACPGKTNEGIEHFSSYDKALNYAQSEQNKPWLCNTTPWWDNHKYKIYLDDLNLCITAPDNTAAITDLIKRIKPFLQRYKAEISNYKRFISGQPYRPGSVINDFHTTLSESEENVRNLERITTDTQNAKLSEIENAFQTVQNDAETLRRMDQKARTQLTENSEPTENTTTLQPQTTVQQQRTNDWQRPQNNQQTQYNAIRDKYRQQREYQQQTNQIIQDGLTQLGDILSDYQKKEEARRETEQLAREQAEAERRIQEERERQKREEREAERERYYLMREAEQRRQKAIDESILGPALKNIRPTQAEDNRLPIYYISYRREENEQTIFIRGYELFPYSDGSWMLYEDFMTAIRKVNGTEHHSKSQIFGYYSTIEEAETYAEAIQVRAAKHGFVYSVVTKIGDVFFVPINKPTSDKISSEDFWKN